MAVSVRLLSRVRSYPRLSLGAHSERRHLLPTQHAQQGQAGYALE